MINHARNLLLNTSPGIFRSDLLFEEIIPQDYVVKSLPAYITSIRRIIFGNEPDRTMLNYRARQLLAVIHNSELQQFVVDLDPRITYELNDTASIAEGFSYTQTSGSENQLGFITADYDSAITGQMLHEWLGTFAAGTIALTKMYKPAVASQSVSFSGGISSLIPLPLSPFNIRIKNLTAKWLMQYLAVPTKDLGQILADIDNLGEETLTSLFGIGTLTGKTEPFLTFYNLWRTSPYTAERLGAVVMAMIYQTDKL